MKRILILSSCIFVSIFLFVRCKKEITTVKVHDTVEVKTTDTLLRTDTLFKKDTLLVKDTLLRTLILQPGPDEGQNCLVGGDLYSANNLNGNPDISASTWTYGAQGGGTGSIRTYLKFIGLDGMPDSAIILSAKLSLYGISSGVSSPQGNSYYAGSPYESFGDNSCWLQRVTSDWNPDSITWNNKPPVTNLNQVSVNASNAQWNFDVIDLDVTQLVDDMLNNENFGFCLQLKTEQIYRSLSFASCKVANASKWPKLVVTYKLIK
jgi:hypothetical protein